MGARWSTGTSVAQQLGRSSPELTLRTYAHVLREEEVDLSFADLGSGGSGRLYASPDSKGGDSESRKPAEDMVTQAGFEPATPSSGG